MADFLSVAGSRSKRLFCASWSTLYAYQISFAYDKVGGGAAILSPSHFRLATPTSENFKFRKFSPSRTCVQKFVSFHGRLGPQKCIRFGRKKEERKKKEEELKPRAVVSGPSHPLAVDFLSFAGGRPKRLFCASWSTVYTY